MNHKTKLGTVIDDPMLILFFIRSYMLPIDIYIEI